MVRLIIHPPSGNSLTYELGTSWITIGRGDINACQIPETTVSDRHCEVKWTGVELMIRDLCSTNGVLVNGQKITEGVVHPGQVIRLGNAEVQLEKSPDTAVIPQIPPAKVVAHNPSAEGAVFSLRQRPLKPAPAPKPAPVPVTAKRSAAPPKNNPPAKPLRPASPRPPKEVFSLRQRASLAPATAPSAPPPPAIEPVAKPPRELARESDSTVFSLRQRPVVTSHVPAIPEAVPPPASPSDTQDDVPNGPSDNAEVFSLRHRPITHSPTEFIEPGEPANPASPSPVEPEPIARTPVAVKVAAPPAETPVASATYVGERKQVLLVDDSLAFLDSFAAICQEFSGGQWQIHTVTSAEQALSFLGTNPVDLAVLDIGMPMVDGIQLLGLIRRRYSSLKVAMLTGLATEANRATCLADGAELFLEKPFTHADLKRGFDLLNALLAHNPQKGFTGTLQEVSLPEVIQLNCLARKSVILDIRDLAVSGRIYIEGGNIIHASAGMMTGEQAFLLTGEQSVEMVGEHAFQALLTLNAGQFQLQPFAPPPARTIHDSWEMLLMNAARYDDETRFLTRAPLPSARSERSMA